MRQPFYVVAMMVGITACQGGTEGGDPDESRALAEATTDAFVLRGSLAYRGAGVTADDPVPVQFTLTNSSDHAFDALTWHTPIDASNSNVFHVEKDGEAVAYTGRLVLRANPSADDYVHLEPGESRTWTIDIGELYDLAVPGRYRVALEDEAQRVRLHSAERADASPVTVARVKTSEVWIDVVEPRRSRVTRAIAGAFSSAPTNTFNNCSSSRRSAAAAARVAGRDLADSARFDMLDSGSRSPIRYQHWFGPWQATRYQDVMQNYGAIVLALGFGPIEFTCSPPECQSNWVAFVHPNQSDRIFLCNPFFDPPVPGGFSRAGVLIHEVSHYDDGVGADDFSGSEERCVHPGHPGRALRNAECYRLFAENTPFLSMSSENPPAPVCEIADDCDNDQFCIAGQCVIGPKACKTDEDCGPGAMCVPTARVSQIACIPGDGCPTPPTPHPAKECRLF
jgi:peptidyl-Lys metalloendopeptidase